MFTFLRVHRTIWRWFLPLILSITVSATILTGIGITTAQPAVAASASDRGPSAAADEFTNQYVFWKGTDSNLWEAYYNSYIGRWNGPIKLGMGPLGSEPSVTVSTQVFAGPGGKEFNAQYVYWRGTDNDIWMAYWNGSWHGPVPLGVGNSGTPDCSQPSATYVGPPIGPRIYIYWKGLGTNGTCGSDVYSTHLWYAFSTTFPAYSGSDYSGPNYDSGSGALGSSPSVTTVNTECSQPPTGTVICPGYVVIAWLGTDGHLWEEIFDVLTGNVYGPTEDAAANTLGSAPSVANNLPPSSGITDTWDAFWRGSSGSYHLWFAHEFTSNLNPSPQGLSSSGSLGSAPTATEAVEGTGINTYVFWKGTDANLWEAYYNGSNGNWSTIGLGMGPLG